MPTTVEIQHRLLRGAQTLGIEVSATQTQQLLALLQLLVTWNRTYNLTAVRDPLAMVGYHLMDSLALLSHIPAAAILDLGTGAGFPGLPLAIMRPEWQFTLLDSNGKKTRFVRQVVMELGLENVQVVQARIEHYQNPVPFATVIARALAQLPQLLDWALPLLPMDGTFLAPKGKEALAEVALVATDKRISQLIVHQLIVPYVTGTRVLVEVRPKSPLPLA